MTQAAPTHAQTRYIDTTGMPQEEINKIRHPRIGGTRMAAIAGACYTEDGSGNKHFFRTPFEVWEEMTKPEPQEHAATDLMRNGVFLEPAIAGIFQSQTGIGLRIPGHIVINSAWDYLHATPDRYMVRDGTGILEITAATTWAHQRWAQDGAPLWKYIQLLTYMAVTGVQYGGFAALVNNQLVVYPNDGEGNFVPLLADDEPHKSNIARIPDMAGEWYQKHIVNGEPPEPQTAEDVKRRWPQSEPGRAVTASPEIARFLVDLADVKDQIKTLKTQQDGIELEIKKFMGKADTLQSEIGAVLATWKTAKNSKQFDAKKFNAAHPALYKKFSYPQPGSRRFLPKK